MADKKQTMLYGLLTSIASKITYDNTTSGLTADNVQDAIDETINRSILDWANAINLIQTFPYTAPKRGVGYVDVQVTSNGGYFTLTVNGYSVGAWQSATAPTQATTMVLLEEGDIVTGGGSQAQILYMTFVPYKE